MDPKQNEQSVPTNALEEAADIANTGELASDGQPAASAPAPKSPKKPNAFKALLRRFNLYFLIFIFIVVIASIFFIVSYLNSKKAPVTPAIATQQLSPEALKQLANSDATVGSSGQTLTVQGNAIFSGQVLVRSDLSVAGGVKIGGDLLVPNITISGKANLADTQINSLQVAQNIVTQGSLTVQKDVNIAGATSLNGPVTANQLTVSKLIMSGNATLQVNNHVAFTGSPANRQSIDIGVLGASGTASVQGSDTTGTVNVNTGVNPTAGCFIAIKFNQPFSSTPHVIVSPINAGAGQTQFYVTRTTTGFSICTTTAAPAQQAFAYDYFVTE